MATAGLTDSAAPRAPPAPGTARDSPGCWPPRARRSRSAAGGHGSSAGPNGPAAASTPATGAGLPAPEAGTARPRSLPSHPHPRTQHPRSHLCPTCSAWRVAKERGAAEQRPPRGKGHRPRFLAPGPAERAAGKWPTLHAPVLGARFPQWQLRCPSRCHLVPASPQTNAARGRPAATANRACACGRGASRAHLLGGGNGRGGRGATARRERAPRLRGCAGGLPRFSPTVSLPPRACRLCKQWGPASCCTFNWFLNSLSVNRGAEQCPVSAPSFS